MQLLDAILAFTLTMGALATVVTLIMEAVVRLSRMRKKNFLQVMKLLDQELGQGYLALSDKERWEFFTKVVSNPTESSGSEDGEKASQQTVENFNKTAGLFEKVSLEYMLRCLAATETVKKKTAAAKENLEAEFDRIARKYEELGSSVSASFKNRTAFWSIIIGIALAFLVNIDGLRIFEAYQASPELAASIIEKQDQFAKSFENAKKTSQDLNGALEKLETAEKKLQEAQNLTDDDGKKAQAIENAKKEKDDAEKNLESQLETKRIEDAVTSAQRQVADLASLGVPLGWDLYPACPYKGSPDQWEASCPKCKAIAFEKRELVSKPEPLLAVVRVYKTAKNDFFGFVQWVIAVLLTGGLIGLGAPFWFDIAKRLSQLRKGVQQATASSEYRLSARDANGDRKTRKEIVGHVLADAEEEARVESAKIPRNRTLLSFDGTPYKKGEI